MSIDIHSVPWYPNEYPEENEAVTVQLTRVDEMGIWVELLEYASKEGMIPLGQYTTRKTRKIPKNVKVGKIDVALVIKVDMGSATMDLSRQGLKEEEKQAAEKRYADYKNLMSLISHLAKQHTEMSFQDLVQRIAYPLHTKYGNAYTALQKSYHNPAIIDDLDILDVYKKLLKEQVQKMFTPKEVRIHSLFEAEVLTSGGVDELRKALSAGYDIVDTEKSNLQLSVIAPPLYAASLTVFNYEEGVETIRKVLERIKEKIEEVKGHFAIKEEPKAINQSEYAKLQKIYENDQDETNINQIDE
ncbi:translation initiation factor 2 subunit 1 [Histomonas meleagridis]|uniref:translation initiation factor 2 subunit 1 n=1 Tax=Histomonas meleagridis TaxID=135588 RepID=UPI003559D52B|nr:translation initiation factor 2 subunit 1 [Histomonas meleagridis]KAH0797002.1 translation initiation factor 2 subunit 1 [Histomonas meleagridis]